MEPMAKTNCYALHSAEELTVDIPLQINDAAREELGPGEDDDNAVYEEEFLGFYSSVRLHPLRFGTLQPQESEDATNQGVIVMIMDLTFHSKKPQKYRFRNAEFSVSFQGQREKPTLHRPIVLGFAPQAAYGRVAATMKTGGQWSLEVTAPMWKVANVGRTWSKEIEREGRFSILGSPRGSPASRVVWVLDEGEGTNAGLPLKVRTAVLLSAIDPLDVCFDVDTSIGLLPEMARTTSKIGKTIAALWSGEASTIVRIDPSVIRERLGLKGSKEKSFTFADLAEYASFTEPQNE